MTRSLSARHLSSHGALRAVGTFPLGHDRFAVVPPFFPGDTLMDMTALASDVGSDGSSPDTLATHDQQLPVIRTQTTELPCARSYKAEVIADRSGKWCSTQVRLATVEEARAYAQHPALRWTLVEQWRVQPSHEPVNFRFEHGRLVPYPPSDNDPRCERAAT